MYLYTLTCRRSFVERRIFLKCRGGGAAASIETAIFLALTWSNRFHTTTERSRLVHDILAWFRLVSFSDIKVVV